MIGLGKRRVIHWERVRGPRGIASLLIGTAFGAGLSPVAPGTMGTIVALPLAYASADWHWGLRVLLWSALLAIGTWSAKTLDELMQTNDNQNIVIDEVVGLGITAWTVGTSMTGLVTAFLLFRLFDVVKPPPIRQVDDWSKKQASRWWSGFGVMVDDVLAGFEALAVIFVLQSLGWLK